MCIFEYFVCTIGMNGLDAAVHPLGVRRGELGKILHVCEFLVQVDRCAEAVPVVSGRQIAHDLSIPQDRFRVIEKRLRILEDELDGHDLRPEVLVVGFHVHEQTAPWEASNLDAAL